LRRNDAIRVIHTYVDIELSAGELEGGVVNLHQMATGFLVSPSGGVPPPIEKNA
jgi:hypothetical protein